MYANLAFIDAIEVAGNVKRHDSTCLLAIHHFHFVAPPLRTNLSQKILTLARAELTCERTVTGREPRACATCSVEKPSISRSTRAARSFAGSDCKARRTSASC